MIHYHSILIFNLRDIKNPNAGGAEVFTHEVAKIWVNSGNKVTMVVSNFKNGEKYELLDGVEIIRLGNMYSVFWLAERYYKKHLKGKYDIIIDEYTLRPFITPNFVKEPIIFLVHELVRDKYFHVLPPVLSHILYYYLEPRWLMNYVNIPTVTVSDSTKDDLIDYGFKEIYMVPVGINFEPINQIPVKEKDPTFLFLGLLKKTNLVDHALEAFKIIAQKLPKANLWIVGRGPEADKLKKLARGLRVTFFGYVSEEKKLELMRRAHVLLVPAIREGWGLVVTEANACGTPSIGYNVPGLRDSIKDKETGLLTERNPEALAATISEFLVNDDLRQKLSENALKWSKTFSWDKTSEKFIKVLDMMICDRGIIID